MAPGAATLVALLLVATTRAEAELRYGIVFDAGSSGSRIHVYKWKTGGGGPKDAFDLVEDDILKIKPGLSAYKDTPSEAGASLLPLLTHAKSKIPAEVVSKTPVFLMATAGLRMVGETAKDAILQSVCGTLSASGFLFKCEWSSVLDGRDEGLYGWVTVNYLLDALYPPAPPEPVGIIDLGGGSVQIVFPTAATAMPEEYAQQLNFNGRKHNLYIKSHLGFGLDAARNAVLDALVSKLESKSPPLEKPMKHPCLPKHATLTHKGHELKGDSDWHKCRKLMRSLFDTSKCAHASCSFGGTYQPQLPSTFYGFSYLYDRTAAIGLLDGKPAQFGTQTARIADLLAAGEALCHLDESAVAERYKGHPDSSKASNFCGDVAYLSTLLLAFGFPESYTMTLTNKVKDVELVWTLGAMLAKSAELAGAGSRMLGGGAHAAAVGLLLAAAALLFFFARRMRGGRSSWAPLPAGHESD